MYVCTVCVLLLHDCRYYCHTAALLTRMVVRMWKVPGTCLKPLPGTQESPVSSSSSKQYITSGALPLALAASIAAGGRLIRGKEYMAPIHTYIQHGKCKNEAIYYDVRTSTFKWHLYINKSIHTTWHIQKMKQYIL